MGSVRRHGEVVSPDEERGIPPRRGRETREYTVRPGGKCERKHFLISKHVFLSYFAVSYDALVYLIFPPNAQVVIIS